MKILRARFLASLGMTLRIRISHRLFSPALPEAWLDVLVCIASLAFVDKPVPRNPALYIRVMAGRDPIENGPNLLDRGFGLCHPA